MTIRVAILTISDRSFKGERSDSAGPALAQRILELGWNISINAIVPDEFDAIQQKLVEWSMSGSEIDLILTTGGTGFAARDVTPEVTARVIQRPAPGLAEAMRTESLKKTPHAMLSRSLAGIRNQTLIINLPGNPNAAVENFEVVIPVIPHAVELLQESTQAEKGHRFSKEK